jgi:inorganic pyrophosphatase
MNIFSIYKDLENKTVDVGGWEMLMKHMKSLKMYRRFDQIENKPEGLFSIKIVLTLIFYKKSNIL